jgi:hypothetical protein
MKKHLQILFFILTALTIKASAQQFVLAGRITDNKGVPISFVSVYIRNSTYGTTSNENGVYRFKLDAGSYDIIYRFVGYKERVEKVTITGDNERLNIQMENEVFNLREISVKDKRNRDTAAANIMRQVIAKRKFYRDELTSYSCNVYVKGVQRLISAPKNLLKSGVSQVLDLDSNGRGILYQSESLSTFAYLKPDHVKEVTVAQKMAGITPAFSYSKASDLQANFYNNFFVINGLSSLGFISPVADNAFKHYNYRLVGTREENGRTIHKIELVPKRPHGQVFRGNIYIVAGDWRIYAVDLTLTKEANRLNLVDTMRISQQYVPIRGNTWMPTTIQYDYSGNVFGFKFSGYYLGLYNNYKFEPELQRDYFDGEILRVDTASNTKTPEYWAKVRPVPLTPLEARDYQKKDSMDVVKKTIPYLDSLQKSKNSVDILPYAVVGYTYTSRSNKDSLYVYPFLQTVFYNTVEGYGVNLKVKYTKVLDDFRTYSISPAVRYGFANKLFSANLHTSYTYDPFKQGMFTFDIGNDVLDLNNVGTRSLYFNTLSTLLSENNYVKYYRSEFLNTGFQREVSNGILLNLGLNYARRTQLFNNSYNHWLTSKTRDYTSNNPLAPVGTPADDRSILFPQNEALTFTASVKFTIDQEYITRPTGRLLIPSKYPTLTVNYRKGIHGILGSDVNYDFASADVSQDRIRIGLSGYSSFKVTGGAFINKKSIYYPDYNHFLGNQGTTFDPTYIGSFHFLPFYTYSTANAFLEAHYQHNFSGSLLKRVPFMRKLKLEEIIGVNYLTEKGNNNYSELYVGLQRFIFRVDYGVSYMGDKKYLQGIRIFYGIR